MAVAALSEGQRTRLTRVFQMYDAEGRGALSEERLRLVLADMGVEPERDESERAAVEKQARPAPAAKRPRYDDYDRGPPPRRDDGYGDGSNGGPPAEYR